jgi:predicted nuclease of predicted toxin-antitoxin system
VPETIRFCFDQHVQGAVARGLQRRGVDVLTAHAAGWSTEDDGILLSQASAAGRVVVTFDPDYLALHAAGVPHAGIVWCHQTKYRIGQLVHLLHLLWQIAEPDTLKNRVEYL